MSKRNSWEEIRASIRELTESQKKTDEQQKKTDEQLRQTDEQLRQTDEQLKKLGLKVGDLTNGWGLFVEGLVAPGIPKIFNKLDYRISGYTTRYKKKLHGDSMEIDVLAVENGKNGKGVVFATSVKSHFTVEDVTDHLEDLAKFHHFYSEFRDYKLLGVVAGIRFDEGVEKYAARKGLYVIGSSGDSVELLSRRDFQPRVYKCNEK